MSDLHDFLKNKSLMVTFDFLYILFCSVSNTAAYCIKWDTIQSSSLAAAAAVVAARTCMSPVLENCWCTRNSANMMLEAAECSVKCRGVNIDHVMCISDINNFSQALILQS